MGPAPRFRKVQCRPEHLYVPLGRNLLAVERATGEIAWLLVTESAVVSPPVLTDDGILVADEAGTVFGIGPGG